MRNEEKGWNPAGKRMPYTVPDGFFEQLEENVWQQVQPFQAGRRREKRHYIRMAFVAIGGMAAAVALAFALHLGHPAEGAPSMEEVELAFCNLSLEDQDFLRSLYADETWMEEYVQEVEETLTIL